MSDDEARHVAEAVRLTKLGDASLQRAEKDPVESYARAEYAYADRYFRAAVAHAQLALALAAARSGLETQP